MLEIYLPYILTSPVTFECEPPTEKEFCDRLALTTKDYPWLVAERGGQVIGYTYATKFRTRAAYQWSVETAVYIGDSSQRSGVARALYQRLFEILKQQSLVRAYAVITVPNEQSVGFHESFGFTPLGVFPKAGYKLGRWHDVGWWQKEVNEAQANPPTPVPFSKL